MRSGPGPRGDGGITDGYFARLRQSLPGKETFHERTSSRDAWGNAWTIGSGGPLSWVRVAGSGRQQALNLPVPGTTF